ncbi:MAG: penicillin-binding protein [Acidobacteriia bacterium]|nr:penicillin-binding protein [Terriglobia bacterium]
MSKIKGSLAIQVVLVMAIVTLPAASAAAATVSTPRKTSKSKSVVENSATQKKISSKRRHRRPSAYVWVNGHRLKRNRYPEHYVASSFVSEDQTTADITAGEDRVVRAAAIDALGNHNGTVVAIDPNSGRVLAMVNQRMALSEGGEPCSTIKIAVALAALSEDVVTRETKIQLGRRTRMDLTQALAHSNNAYFEALGRKMGFEKVSYYAHQFGLGELAGWNLEGEHLGVFPSEELDPRQGGVGRMCSFGQGISMTPLQLGALVSAIANGGTLYYLQHPTTADGISTFEPRVKRYLDIGPLIPQVSPGMAAAVQYGTAQSVRWNFSEEEVLGKTGTCSNNGTRYGWFASFANTAAGRIAVVVFLEGGRPTFGPKAAEIAGRMYRNLYDHSFFVQTTPAPDKTGVGVTQ